MEISFSKYKAMVLAQKQRWLPLLRLEESSSLTWRFSGILKSSSEVRGVINQCSYNHNADSCTTLLWWWAKPKDRTLDLLLYICSYPDLWPCNMGHNWKNKIQNTKKTDFLQRVARQSPIWWRAGRWDKHLHTPVNRGILADSLFLSLLLILSLTTDIEDYSRYCDGKICINILDAHFLTVGALSMLVGL